MYWLALFSCMALGTMAGVFAGHLKGADLLYVIASVYFAAGLVILAMPRGR